MLDPSFMNSINGSRLQGYRRRIESFFDNFLRSEEIDKLLEI